MASRIQLKRSSILGKRPSGQYLEPGELALNTNQNDPGLFFETNSGDIAKVGPTHIGIQPPTSDVGYGNGETWLDAGNGTFNIWVPALNKWVPVQSALFGGATTAIFVGSEFPEASDDLSNDGIARPFATLNRALVEVARRSILAGRADELYNGRFTILLLPGRNVVYNEPGVTLGEFEEQVSGFTEDQTITQSILRLFNSPDGGLLVPRGTSIIALDLRKTELRPTYYPFWSRTLFEVDPSLIENRSSIFKWTGNCYFTSFVFKDKVDEVSVTQIDGDSTDVAILRAVRPHGFRALVTSTSSSNDVTAADRVTVAYPAGVSQLYAGVPVASAGEYYADPINAYEFRLRKVTDASILTRNELPEYGVPGSNPPEFAIITYSNTSHHRLTALEFATQPELNVYYSKVQRAFSLLTFAGTVNNAEVAPGETTIVASTPAVPDFYVDTVDNSSPYAFNCSVRSDWGMCSADVDGSKVSGFKSALFCNFTSVSLQNDSEVYEVYDSVSSDWISLKQKYANVTNTPIAEVSNIDAIEYLISPAVKVEDVRFFYRPGNDIPGQDGKSSGLTSSISDTRNYGVLCQNNGFSQIVSSFAIGVAINYWAKSGGQVSVTNANSNFGGIALRAEGFSGIGSGGGAETADTGFIVEGVRRPSVITRQMVEDQTNIRRIFANCRISGSTVTTLTLDTQFNTGAILPFTLKPGTYIWVEDYTNGVNYKAQLATAGSVLSNGNLTINIVNGTNDIHTALFGGLSVDSLSLPYLRRFVDPRPAIDRTYSFWLSNTNAAHRPPEIGAIMRYAEKPPSGSTNLLKIGAQLDPGLTGGWGHLFQVADSRTKAEGDNPNGSDPLIVPALSASNYYVTVLGVDQFRPWITEGTNGFDTNPVDTDYPQGFYATYSDRAYYATKNDLAAEALKPLPTSGSSVWLRAKNFEFCQPVEDAWESSPNVSVEDPFYPSYPSGAVYPRGVQYDRTTSTFNLVIDEDNGTNTLGILNTTGNTNLAQPSLYDPWWHPTKAAVTRFLALLGFAYDDIDDMLQPQFWTSRNLAVGSMPNVTTGGYAQATGQWPLEFNRPSTIRSGNHTWEWSGYINYAKGLQRYQDSQLSLRERFDAMLTEIWGGVVFSTGTTERGEFSITGKTVAGGTGVTLLRIDEASQENFADQSTVLS